MCACNACAHLCVYLLQHAVVSLTQLHLRLSSLLYFPQHVPGQLAHQASWTVLPPISEVVLGLGTLGHRCCTCSSHTGSRDWTQVLMLILPTELSPDLLFISIASPKTLTSSHLKRNVYFKLYFQVTIQHQWKTKEKHRVEAWSLKNHGRILLTGLLRYFSNKAWPTCLGMAPPISSWILLHQLIIKKMPHRHGHKPIWLGTILQ